MLFRHLKGLLGGSRNAENPAAVPLDPQAVVDRSRALQRVRDFDQAGALIEELLARSGAQLGARSRGDLLIDAALCRLRQFRLEEARRLFEECRKCCPDHPLIADLRQYPALVSERIALERRALPAMTAAARSAERRVAAVYYYLDTPDSDERDRWAYAELLRRSVASLKAAMPGARAVLVTDRSTRVPEGIGLDAVVREDLDATALVHSRLVALAHLLGTGALEGDLILLDPDTLIARDVGAVFDLDFDLGFTLRSDFVEAAMDHEPINVGVIFVRASGAARARSFFQLCLDHFSDIEARPAVRQFYTKGLRGWRGDQVLPAAVVGWHEFFEHVLSGRTNRLQVAGCVVGFFESRLYNCSDPGGAAAGGEAPYIVHYKGQQKVQILQEAWARRSG
jgi:hypothetical protein